ncbi:MAG: hypothetical protein KKH44_10890 [Bacteroidetes bacterium]|nr:hypothetical protein [Bacteroidota bacterium]
MNKFSIFKKTKKIYWSVNKIYYCALFSILGLGYISQQILKPTELFFQWLAIIGMIIGLIFKFKGFTQVEPIRGKLEGNLIFEKESISVDGKLYVLNEISKIRLTNDDYSGKLIHISKGNIGPALSNGTNNSIIIFLKSEETIQSNFELINSNDFQNIKTILITYYLKGKIDFDELRNLLGAKNCAETRELREEVTEISTTANARF